MYQEPPMITLFKKSTHSTRLWKAYVTQCTLNLEHGTCNGLLQHDTIEHPSPEEAEADLQSRVAKKIAREGYSEDPEADPPGLPMLAHQFREYSNKLPYNVYFQPKLDGYRCIGTKHTMMSRKRDIFTSLPHIQQALSYLPDGARIDGELYCHGMSLQQLGGFVRSYEPQQDHEMIRFAVFDVQMPGPFRDRMVHVASLTSRIKEAWNKRFNPNDSAVGQPGQHGSWPCPIYSVPTTPGTRDQADYYLKRYTDNGYEGAIIRSPELLYHTDHRSYLMQKYKPLLRCWYNLKSITCSNKGREAGLAIAVCKMLDGQTFRARCIGSRDLRKFIYENRDLMLPGRALIEFSDFTDAGKPSPPRCLEIVKGAQVAEEKVQKV